MMKKRKAILFFSLYLFLSLCIAVVLNIIIYTDQKKIETYSDVTLYFENCYGDLIDDSSYKEASKKAAIFFPSYDTFPYSNYINDFAVYSGLKTYAECCISISLELKFDSDEEINDFLEYEFNRLLYGEVVFLYNNYSFYLVNDNNINDYLYKEKHPFKYGLLCYNLEKRIIRYIYFYDLMHDEGNYGSVIEHSNLSWE